MITTDPFPPPGFIPAPSTIEGIQVYAPAPPESGPQQEVVEFKCPQCGATTAFSAADGGLTCTHCGYYEAPQKPVVGKGAEQFEFTTKTMERAAQGWGAERKDMLCQSCGAQTSVPAESLSHTCPFCGSNNVTQRQAIQDVLRPRFLIPFKVEAAACSQIARTWLGSSWMTPASLRQTASLAAFTGVYLPYWTFDALTSADWKAQVGHQETERYYENGEWKTRTRTVWRWESGRAQLQIDDLLVPGAGRLSQKLLGEMQGFDLQALASYEPKYLAGFQAQSYDVPLEQAWETGREKMREQTRQACLGQASTAQVRNFSMSLDFADESWRYILLPVYLAAYTYASKTFQVMVNGQTGAIAGQRPVDWNKVWMAIAALLVPGLFLGLVGLVTIPLGGLGVFIGGLGFVLLVIGVVLAFILYRKADSLDDI